MTLALALAVVGLLSAVVVFLWMRRLKRELLGAVLEQARRESEHHIDYRPEQTVLAIQQRLSRAWGRRALTPLMKRRIEAALGLDQ